MHSDLSQVTFATLDKQKNIPELAPTGEKEYPLPTWYREVRNTPLNKLTVEDISKACRQSIHLQQIVPLALSLLKANPLEGEMYDGELIVSLKAVPRAFWADHAENRMMCFNIIKDFIDACPENVADDAKELLLSVTQNGP